MTYQPRLSSAFNDTQLRSRHISPESGMCSLCTQDCEGLCEIALSSVLGAQTVYPTNTGTNQIASEKDYSIDYSHFNINGRVFGALGCKDLGSATIYHVNTEKTYGDTNKVKLAMPIILPALIKLDWKDYFAGAAMAGVTAFIGEGARNKDPLLEIKNNQIVSFPMLQEMLNSFLRYNRGYGQIVLQCNVEDDLLGLPEYAIKQCQVEALEFKFGQGAKGTQPVVKLKNRDAALEAQNRGELVLPNPLDSKMQDMEKDGCCANFYSYGRLPMWEEEYLSNRIKELKQMGLKNVYFKMAGFDAQDIEQVLRLGSKLRIDMITFDGAGGGSGYSPCKMMNEWGLPTVVLEDLVERKVAQLKRQGLWMPAISITGGISSEDQVFKALAYGGENLSYVGICRAAMTAAMTGKNIGEKIKNGNIPQNLKSYGNTVEEIFGDLPDLRSIYGMETNKFDTGAIGVFSFLNKINFGIKHFAALNRKFDLSFLNKSDLIPMTRDAKDLMRGQWW